MPRALPAIGDIQISPRARGQIWITRLWLASALLTPILAVTLNNLDRQDVLTLAPVLLYRRQSACRRFHRVSFLLASRVPDGAGRRPVHATAIASPLPFASLTARPRHRPGDVRPQRLQPWSAFPSAPMIATSSAGAATFVMVAHSWRSRAGGLMFGLPRGPAKKHGLARRAAAVARHDAVLYALATTALWAVGGFTISLILSIPLHGLDSARRILA